MFLFFYICLPLSENNSCKDTKCTQVNWMIVVSTPEMVVDGYLTQILWMLSHCALAPIVSNKKSAVSHTKVPSWVMVHSAAAFKNKFTKWRYQNYIVRPRHIMVESRKTHAAAMPLRPTWLTCPLAWEHRQSQRFPSWLWRPLWEVLRQEAKSQKSDQSRNKQDSHAYGQL